MSNALNVKNDNNCNQVSMVNYRIEGDIFDL